jgi:hypothetical protein
MPLKDRIAEGTGGDPEVHAEVHPGKPVGLRKARKKKGDETRRGIHPEPSTGSGSFRAALPRMVIRTTSGDGVLHRRAVRLQKVASDPPPIRTRCASGTPR